MDDFSIINIIIGLCFFLVTYWLFVKRDKNSLIEKGNKVIIRGSGFSRVFNTGVKSVNKSDIVKIQDAGSYISLFNSSSNAYDIFVITENVTTVFEQAKSLFQTAEIIEIKD